MFIGAALLCMVLAASFAWASSAKTVWLHADGKYPLDGKLRMLRDPAGTLAADEIVAHDHAGGFLPLADNLSVGFTSDVIWLAFTLSKNAGSSSKWWLEIMPPLVEHVDLYGAAADGTSHIALLKRGGIAMPASARDIAYHNTAFLITVADDKPHSYYLRLQTNTTLALRATVWSPNAFTTSASSEMSFFGIYYGIWLMILMFSITQCWLNRQRVRCWWTLYALCDGLFIFSLSGFSAQYLAPDHPDIAQRLPGLSLGMTIMAFSFFSVELYAVRSFSLLVTWGLRAIGATGVLCAGLLVLFGTHSLTLRCLQLNGLAITIISLLLAIRALRKRQSGSAWYFTGSVIMTASTLFVLARNFGMIAPGRIIDYLLQANILTHVILLYVGMEQTIVSSKRDRTKAQKLVLRARTTLQSANEQKQSVALVSHEFHNTLGMIDVAVGNLRRVNHDAPPEVMERYHKIEQASHHLQNLVDNFLTEERISFGLRKAKIDFPALVFEIVHLAQTRTNTHQIVLDAPTLLADLCADQEFLKVALLNVLLNAIKYSPQGGDIVMSIRNNNETLQIAICDQGIGIAPDKLPHVFDKYYRIHHTGSRGVGLGLHLVKSIIELHDGQVTVQSTEGVGTTVMIRLPVLCHSSELEVPPGQWNK